MGELFKTETNIPNNGAKKNFQMAAAAVCLVAGLDCSNLTLEEADSMTVRQMANNLLDENYRRWQVAKELIGMDLESRKARKVERHNMLPSRWGVAGRVLTYLSTLSSDTCTQRPPEDIAQVSEPSNL